MCELFAMSSRLAATVSFSLEEFSRHGGITGPHRDGWGIAYFEGTDVRLIKEPEAAADSAFVRFVKDHELASNLVISHIRKATQGVRALRNTQPFVRELGGRVHVFAHNGDLSGVTEHAGLSLGSYHPVGETDSEHVFCALLARLQELWLGGAPPSFEHRLQIVAEFATTIAPLGPANFIYADGELVFAHGNYRRQAGGGFAPPGLWTLCRSCSGEATPVSPGLSIGSDHAHQEVTLIASVPLSDESWTPLAEGEIIVLSKGKILYRR